MTRKADFQRVRKEGRSYPGRFLLLGVLQDDAVPDLRVGLITTRRVGIAADRVRCRRVIRGVIQREGDQLMPGHFLVTVFRGGAAKAEHGALEKEWLKLARRAGLLGEKKDQPEGVAS